MLKRIIELNFILLKTKGLSPIEKIQSFIREFTAVISLILFRDKRINYLGKKISYDDPSTIFTLFLYPDEVLNKVLNNTDGKIQNVLDIGGNLGQFPLTMALLNRHIERVDVFEPNKEIYQILEKNTRNVSKINVYNKGIGPDGTKTFYHAKNKSAKGSLIKDNAVVQDNELIESQVELVSNVQKTTGISEYDLTVIDVEGFEFDVIKQLANIKTRYLFVEVSGLARKKDYSTSEFFALVEKNWGSYEVVHQSDTDKHAEAYDVMLKFIQSDGLNK